MNYCVPTSWPAPVTTCHTIFPWVAYFLLCHTTKNEAACGTIYGTGPGTLCHGGAGAMFPGGCQAER